MIAAANAVDSTAAVHREHAREADYYRADIDGLRGLAVIAVVAFHAFPTYFPGGFVGVDVFFVISGFLISGIILRQLERSRFTYLQFYVRRVLRIFPALAVVLATTLLLGAIVLLPDEMAELGKHVASAATFISNFTLWQETGYFNRAAELKPLLHLWSLGVEEQFYLIWPLALAFLWRWRGRHFARYVLLLSAGSFVAALVLGSISSTANFYLPFSRFWELGIGCFLAVVLQAREASPRVGPSLSDRARSALMLSGVALIALAILALDRRTPFPGVATLIPTLGAAAVIVAHAKSGLPFRMLGTGGLLRAGLISYPLYLWHWPLLSFAAILESGEPRLSTRLIAILASVVLAWLTYTLLERPIRTRRRRRDAAVLVVALAVLGGIGLFVYTNQGFPGRFDMDVRALRPEPRTTLSCKERFPKGMKFNYCKATSAAPPKVVFLGDSRAQAVYDGVAAASPDTSLLLLARGGCPPLLEVELRYRAEENCPEVWDYFANYVAKTAPPLVVLVGGGYDLFDPRVADMTATKRSDFGRETAFAQGFRKLLASLGRTSRVIYVTQFPRFESAPGCFLRSIQLPGIRCAPTLMRADLNPHMVSYERILGELQTEFPRLRVVDSMATLCDESRCRQRAASGEVLYTDEIHLSPAGGRYFVEASGLLDMLFEEDYVRPN